MENLQSCCSILDSSGSSAVNAVGWQLEVQLMKGFKDEKGTFLGGDESW